LYALSVFLINKSGKCKTFSAKTAMLENAVFGSLRRFAASRISVRLITWSKTFLAPSNNIKKYTF
jgi:hypothetical protein